MFCKTVVSFIHGNSDLKLVKSTINSGSVKKLDFKTEKVRCIYYFIDFAVPVRELFFFFPEILLKFSMGRTVLARQKDGLDALRKIM